MTRKSAETKRAPRPKVYVIQSQFTKDGSPKYDLTPAEDYGELVYLLDDTASPFRTKKVWDQLSAALASFRDGDYILPVGNPVFIGLASIAAADSAGLISYLVWSTREQRYIAVETDTYNNEI